jgi:hypothetical protein
MNAFVEHARDSGVLAVSLDCRIMEPSERGFLHDLGKKVEANTSTIGKAAAALASLGDRVVLALDSYERFRAMDTWFRLSFLPAMSENIRVFFFGRDTPVPIWLIAPEWQHIFHSVTLGPLDSEASAEFLRRSGLQESDIAQIVRFAHGVPLALRLAAATILERPDLDLQKIASQTVIAELTKTYISDVQDLETRYALEAFSVVRRMNNSLLKYMLPSLDSNAIYACLQELPFVETAIDGLVLHDSVQEAIATSMKVSDPSKYREYRRQAWKFYRNEAKIMAQSELWRHSADMLYMIEEPLIREAFFPSTLQPYAIEKAKQEDDHALQDIIRRFEGKEGAKALLNWLTHAREVFFVARAKDGSVAGFYIAFDPREVKPGLLRSDPVSRRLVEKLEDDPLPPKQKATFLRRWLDAETGEGLSPVVSACFLDIKGYYIAVKPWLRRLYCTRTDYDSYAELFKGLRFKYLKDHTVDMDGRAYHTCLLDFGPALFNGWITSLVGREIGIEEEDILDVEACALVIDGKQIGLTPLELGVMQHLEQHEGEVVKRVTLLENVWGYDKFSGSNVVDTKISSIRKKLGDYAPMIETVSGIGYRFKKI